MSHAATTPGADQRFAPAATIAVVLSLLGLNLANHLLGWDSLWLGPAGALALLAFARASGLSWHQLGLARRTHASGLRWGGLVIAAVGVVYLVGVLLPVTRSAFLDVRYHLPPASILFTAFVLIPLGTVMLEEVAFRSVLWGMLARHARMWQVLLGSSLLFGLWHVIPATASAGNAAIGSALAVFGGHASVLLVIGTVLFTALGGLVAGELRRRSGSVLASIGMHWATNGLGVLFGAVAWGLAV
ncbi:MAG: CPBP family intramembrane metalloprotease [Actinomycetales bacterium]|nr:CPBP family intramembrane metalloprotease [Actinomycetales bacterium]